MYQSVQRPFWNTAPDKTLLATSVPVVPIGEPHIPSFETKNIPLVD